MHAGDGRAEHLQAGAHMCDIKNADMLHAMLTSWLQQVLTIRHVRCAFAITNLDAAEVRCQAHLHGTPLRVPAKLGTRPEPTRRCRAGLQETLSPCAEQPAQSPSKLAGLARAIAQVNAGPPWGTMRVRRPSAIAHVAPGHARCTLNAYTATPSLPHDCATGGAAMCHTCTGGAVNVAEGWVPKHTAGCRACYGPQIGHHMAAASPCQMPCNLAHLHLSLLGMAGPPRPISEW